MGGGVDRRGREWLCLYTDHRKHTPVGMHLSDLGIRFVCMHGYTPTPPLPHLHVGWQSFDVCVCVCVLCVSTSMCVFMCVCVGGPFRGAREHTPTAGRSAI